MLTHRVPAGNIIGKKDHDACLENAESSQTMRVPLITEIQRFSLQDGPGIRTTLFVKGCPLRCPWCHNPENHFPGPSLYYYANRCTNCSNCVSACPNGAVSLVAKDTQPPYVLFDRALCKTCMNCVSACLSGSRKVVGQVLGMDELLRELTADKPFFDSSGGGVTISGGEPLMFADFTRNVCTALKNEGIHVAVETSACVNGVSLDDFVEQVDLFIVDLKTLDPDRHQDVIGGKLELVLNNIDVLIARKAAVRVHIPVISEFNDSSEDYKRFALYLGERAPYLTGVDILPYHCYGESKYSALGKPMDPKYCKSLDMPSESIRPLFEFLKSAGVKGLTVGGMVGVNDAV